MIATTEMLQYAGQAAAAIEAGTLARAELTVRCPECGQTQSYLDNDEHLVVPLTAYGQGSDVAVVVGCEGYWVLNPALVGIDRPNWHPQAPPPAGSGVCDRCGEWETRPDVHRSCPCCWRPWDRLITAEPEL